MYRQSTPQEEALKRELEKRGVIVEAGKFDGHKTIDLVIHRARLNIEVDGKQHYQDCEQILSDLKRTHYSDLRGYDTIHIPNILIDNEIDLHKVADALACAAREKAHRMGHRLHHHHYANIYS